MPTNVTGNPTGVSVPSPQPGPDTFVVVAEPIDGEGATAASVNQGFTALANEQAWEKKPTAGAPAAPTGLDAAFVQPVKAYRNVRLQRRDFVDHRGYAHMARVSRWQEDWSAVALTAKTSAGSGAWGGPWNYYISAPGGTTPNLQTRIGPNYHPSTDAPFMGPYLLMETGTIGPALVVQHVEAPLRGVMLSDDIECSLQTELGGFGGGGEWAFGMINSTLIGNTSALASSGAIGAALLLRNGDTTFHLYYCTPGGSPQVIDTTISSGVRARIDILGANCSDDATARIIVYIDGAPVLNRAAAFDPGPPATNLAAYFPFFRAHAQSEIIPCFGVTDFAANRYAGDIAY